jgi:hypothetical protein
MAKEFKDYDKIYRPQPATVEERESSELITGWEKVVNSWTAEQVRHAVYEAPDADEWQEYRVGMKGTSTQVKLLRLERWLKGSGNDGNIDRIRVDNYIGALIRGGLLYTGTLKIKG